MFILGISAYYMLKGRDFAFAKRSLCYCCQLRYGCRTVRYRTRYLTNPVTKMGDVQKTKLAAIETEWKRNLLRPLLPCSAF